MLTSCGSKTSIQTTGESSENVGVNSVRPDETLQVTEVPSESVGENLHTASANDMPVQTPGKNSDNVGANSIRSDAMLQTTEAPSDPAGGASQNASEMTKTTQNTGGGTEHVAANNISPNITQQEKHDTVKISILNIDGNDILKQTEVEFKEGQTVYDVLLAVTKANNIELKTRGKGSFLYVESIGGIAEFDQGPLSGWIYFVNGQKPDKSAGAYKLKPKDEIIWKFVENAQ